MERELSGETDVEVYQRFMFLKGVQRNTLWMPYITVFSGLWNTPKLHLFCTNKTTSDITTSNSKEISQSHSKSTGSFQAWFLQNQSYLCWWTLFSFLLFLQIYWLSYLFFVSLLLFRGISKSNFLLYTDLLRYEVPVSDEVLITKEQFFIFRWQTAEIKAKIFSEGIVPWFHSFRNLTKKE